MTERPVEAEIVDLLRGLLEQLGDESNQEIRLEIPRQKGFGDLSSNVAMTRATPLGRKPREIAEYIAANYPTSVELVEKVEIAGPGFLNFHLSRDYYYSLLQQILTEPDKFGDGNDGHGAKWNFEFVSANPTGPLNVVSARAASIGDALVRIFRKRGFDAKSEYYFNNAGRQVRLFGASLKARYAQLITGAETAEIPEDGYHGEYIADIAQAWIDNHPGQIPGSDEETGAWASGWMQRQQKTQLETFRVSYDVWFSEASLHDSGQVEQVISRMKGLGHAYEKEGALWFKATEFGDNDDRVMVTSEGRPTYRVPDMAYHINKFERGFEKAVVLLGPDHHGAINTLTAALKALGLPDGFYNGMIVQQVNLMRDGEPVKMSKRAGQMVTLDELVEEVGVDAARFFFLRRKVTTPLDFDIELAKRHSDENPVFYVQYAHARICSILRQPGAEVSKENVDYTLLKADEELDMLRTLALFPWTLSAVTRGIDPSLMTTYLSDVARAFHYFYTKQRVITDDKPLTTARLKLCQAVAIVLKNGLDLIGVEAPERM